tara:strand:- start:256 stop:567 length:312 start_codon:yes stop_codon:yes gene_type:complete
MFEGSDSWADWMIVEPSLEQEFKLEYEAIAIKEDDQHKEIAELCARLSKQTWYQQELIKQATARILELEAEIACTQLIEEIAKEKKRPWWRFFNSGRVKPPNS